ncbi:MULTISPECIES: pentapeptide repeat-containing protein [Streptomyces]|uniref:Pentapeptide repeat-containing protein n=1 Tax=Streptomyces ramulosus TaxID=47762 RepID=A0ABW1FRS7_9ACTN
MSEKRELPVLGADAADLESDCSKCFGLCCVALPFEASSDFAVGKAAGTPCTNLRDDFRCGIHHRLRERGFSGCTVFDCFGAGQKVSQVTFGGRHWRESPGVARRMFEVFPAMRQLHELLRYLAEALAWPQARAIRGELRRAYDDLDGLTRGSAEEITGADVAVIRQQVNGLLLRTSELVRADIPGRKKNHRGADLIGARMHGARLRGASLRGAYLIGADLSGADLRSADVIGADFRDTDVCGADLTDCLFLTQAQLNAAKGDAATRIPSALVRPGHWSLSGVG